MFTNTEVFTKLMEGMSSIDISTFETLWPSLLGIAGMTAAMIYGYFKISSLIKRDAEKNA